VGQHYCEGGVTDSIDFFNFISYEKKKKGGMKEEDQDWDSGKKRKCGIVGENPGFG